MSENDDRNKKIKVTDRRMFTAEGDLREIGAAETRGRVGDPAPGSTTETEAEVRDAVADKVGAEPHREPLGRPEFVDLVSVLAEPIAILLGDVKLPDGSSAQDLDLARFHIDLLDLLKKRTDSSLSSSERAMLDDLLYRLRMRYVQKRG